MDPHIESVSDSQKFVFWVPAKHLLHQPFIRYQEALSIRAITPKLPSIPVFVSHRWLDKRFPDPGGNQRHIVIRFLIEAICLSKDICERYFSFSEPEIILNPRLRDQIRNHKPSLSTMVRYDDDIFAPLIPDEDIATLLARWLKQNFPFLMFETEELIAIGEVLDDIGIWYDYMCIPQKPFTSKSDELYFEWALANLTTMIKQSHVLIIWDKKSNDRGWCLLEGIVAEKEKISNFDAAPNTNWKIAIFDLGYGYPAMHPNKQIALYLQKLAEKLSSLSLPELQGFFGEKRIVCTQPEDVSVVCKLIFDYLSELPEEKRSKSWWRRLIGR